MTGVFIRRRNSDTDTQREDRVGIWGPGPSALRWVCCFANPGEPRTVGGLQKLEEGKDGVFF